MATLTCSREVAPLVQRMKGEAASNLIDVLVQAGLPADDGET